MIWAYIIFLLSFYLIFRNQIEWTFPLFMVRSKKFTKEVYHAGLKHQWVLRGFFTIGVLIGALLMVYSFIYLLEGVLRIGQEEIARISFVLPGQKVGGVTLPLIHWVLAIAATLIVHEGGHAIASAAERAKPKSVALVMFLGIIPGAGVELNEEKVNKLPSLNRLRIISAGTFMNILLAVLVILASFPLAQLQTNHLNIEGITVTNIEENSPADGVLEEGMTITRLNGLQLNSVEKIKESKEVVEPNSEVFLETDEGFYVLKTNDNGKMGFNIMPNATPKKDPISQFISWLGELFTWIFLISAGVGIANMMPLWPFDGGLMVKEITDHVNAKKLLTPIYLITLLLVLLNFFSPQIRTLM